MIGLVLLDNTVLTNFALINRIDLVLGLWPNACTTPIVQAEYQAGIVARGLRMDAWDALPIVTLTAVEETFMSELLQGLDAGESSCLVIAYHRNGLFASDDRDARREAEARGIFVTGTIGVLLRNIQQERITLETGNTLLRQLIKLGYRSPITDLRRVL